MKKRNQVTQRRKRSINYDKTGGQEDDRTVTRVSTKEILGRSF